jgi:hypothetical protein
VYRTLLAKLAEYSAKHSCWSSCSIDWVEMAAEVFGFMGSKYT